MPGSPTVSPGESGGGDPGDRSSSPSGKAGSRHGETSPRLVDRTGRDLLPETHQNTRKLVDRIRKHIFKILM